MGWAEFILPVYLLVATLVGIALAIRWFASPTFRARQIAEKQGPVDLILDSFLVLPAMSLKLLSGWGSEEIRQIEKACRADFYLTLSFLGVFIFLGVIVAIGLVYIT